MKIILPAILLVLFCTTMSLAADNALKKIDTNNDGKISKKEYGDAVIKTFNKIDRNKDSLLTKDELQAADKIDVEKFFKEGDMNKDGKISQDEFTRASEKRFMFLDKNNDGFIDQKEWNDIKDGVTPKNLKISPVAPFVIFRF